MEAEVLKHIKDNLSTLQIWADNKIRVQPSHDILKPIIPSFQKEFPSVNINGCPECVTDMICWAVIEYKKTIDKPLKNKTN